MPNQPNSDDQVNVDDAIKERFKQLPKVVQDAITSANVQKQLQELASGHKLHVDQWSKLENEVMLTLLGFSQTTEMAANLQNEVGVSAEEATGLANDINKIVFEPIRQELERGLSHPEAQEKQVSAEEAARAQIMSSEAAASAAVGTETPAVPTIPPTNPVTPVLPATPPQPKPTEKAVRAPLSSAYTARQPSTERKSIDGDPYRELPQ